MRFGIIYMATSPSGKSYIGQTVQALNERIRTHVRDSKQYSYAFANAIRKYGIDKFEWKVLYDNIPEANLALMEIWLIAKHETYESGYNSSTGGEVGPPKGHGLGRRHTLEELQKMSKANSGENSPMFGKKYTDEQKRKFSISHGGRSFYILCNGSMVGEFQNQTECSKIYNITAGKISACLRGKLSQSNGYTFKYVVDGPSLVCLSDETKLKMSKTQLGRKATNAVRRKQAISHGGKPFYILKDRLVVDEFCSQIECAEKYNLNRTCIQDCLYGQQKTHRGYTFRYREEA